MDPTLSFEPHVSSIIKTSYFHLRNIAKITLSLPPLPLNPSYTPSSPLASTTATPSSPASPPTPSTDSKWFRTLLPVYSPTPGPVIISLLFSVLSTGYPSNNASHTKFCSSFTKPSTASPLITYLTSSLLTTPPKSSDHPPPSPSPYPGPTKKKLATEPSPAQHPAYGTLSPSQSETHPRSPSSNPDSRHFSSPKPTTSPILNPGHYPLFVVFNSAPVLSPAFVVFLCTCMSLLCDFL